MSTPLGDLLPDKSVYYYISGEPKSESIPNATEKNIENLFSEILDSIRRERYRTCVGIRVNFIEYFYVRSGVSSMEFDVLLPDEKSGVRSFIRPTSIAHARLVRFEHIGKIEAPLQVSLLFPYSYSEEASLSESSDEEEVSHVETYDEEEVPPLEDYEADDEPEDESMGVD